jgi:hypothetical protein
MPSNRSRRAPNLRAPHNARRPLLIVDFLLFGHPILNQRIYSGAEMFAPDKQSVSEVLVVGVECKYGVFIHQNILLDVGD